MHQGIFEKIIGRAATDAQFRKKILEDPEIALAEYNLTKEQITAVRAIPIDALEKLAESIGESFTKAQSLP